MKDDLSNVLDDLVAIDETFQFTTDVYSHEYLFESDLRKFFKQHNLEMKKVVTQNSTRKMFICSKIPDPVGRPSFNTQIRRTLTNY